MFRAIDASEKEKFQKELVSLETSLLALEKSINDAFRKKISSGHKLYIHKWFHDYVLRADTTREYSFEELDFVPNRTYQNHRCVMIRRLL